MFCLVIFPSVTDFGLICHRVVLIDALWINTNEWSCLWVISSKCSLLNSYIIGICGILCRSVPDSTQSFSEVSVHCRYWYKLVFTCFNLDYHFWWPEKAEHGVHWKADNMMYSPIYNTGYLYLTQRFGSAHVSYTKWRNELCSTVFGIQY